jgi:hypothetical protein
MHALLVQTIVACFPSTQDGDGHSWAECGCDYVYDQLEAWVEEHPDHWPLAAHISTIVYMLDVYAARHGKELAACPEDEDLSVADQVVALAEWLWIDLEKHITMLNTFCNT